MLDKIKFDGYMQMHSVDDTGILMFRQISIYFRAPVEMLEGKYPEAESMEIELEFPDMSLNPKDVNVWFSPVKGEEEYDWFEADGVLSIDDIANMVEMYRQHVERKKG